MNLHMLTEFCRKHEINIEYSYSPKWGMHRLDFMGKNGNNWLKFNDRIHDDELRRVGEQIYSKGLLERLTNEFLPMLKEGKNDGSSENLQVL